MTTTEQHQEACLVDARLVYIPICHVGVVAEVGGLVSVIQYMHLLASRLLGSTKVVGLVRLRLEMAMLGDREN